MKTSLQIIAAAALTGGSFVQAAAPVVDMSPSAGGSVVAVPAQTVQVPSPVKPRANPNAELLLMLDQLQEEVRYLRGQLEEQGNQIRRMREDQRDRYRDLDRRIIGLNERVDQQGKGALPVLPASVAASSVRPLVVVSTTDTAPTGQSPAEVSDTQAYKDAFSRVRAREYPQALQAFEMFRQQYPSSILIPNVLYWTGEVNRVKTPADLEAARAAYADMLSSYPEHAKSADALYKLGLTYAALGDRDKANLTMQAVTQRFPNHASAKLARDYLARN